jgi:hypothetical protein
MHSDSCMLGFLPFLNGGGSYFTLTVSYNGVIACELHTIPAPVKPNIP